MEVPLNELELIDGMMDSREIARVTGKRHDHVLRDIQAQLGMPGVVPGGLPKFGDTYQNEQNGQIYRCYRLPKRECLILASGYDVVLRTAIIDRWIELESAAQASVIALPNFADPVAAARAWADAKEAEKLALTQVAALEQHVAELDIWAEEIAEPAVNFVAAVQNAGEGSMGSLELSAFLRIPNRTMLRRMRERGIIMRRGFTPTTEHRHRFESRVNIYTNPRTLENATSVTWLFRMAQTPWLRQRIA